MPRPIQTVSAAAIAAVLLAMPLPAHAADPTTADCLSANNRSIDLRNDHKLRAARGQLLICAANNCPADIRKECIRRVDEVNAQIPTIIFEAKDMASGKDLSAVKVTMDGEVLAERMEGTAISVDPGTHTFTFETAGQAPVTMAGVIIQQAQKDRRESVAFGTPTKIVEQPLTPLPRPAPAGLGTQRILAIVAGGIGVAGLGMGTAFGVMTMSKKNDAQNACPNQCTTQDGVNMWNDATTVGNISTVGFIVGGVGLAGAAVLWFTAPSASSGASTQVGLWPGGVQVKGAW